MKRPATACHCGRPLPYAACCGRWHAGEPAPDAEALMRSRYSAYVLGLEDYLLASWASGSRPERLDLRADPVAKWTGLEVRRHEIAGPDTAIVEFVARYKINGRACKLHETSRFQRREGRWFYVDGDTAG